MVERVIALVLIVLLLPILVLLSLLITVIDGWPFWYRQQRTGLHGREFGMWKFRTMVKDADKRKVALKSQNEADGPVFKIRNDPRFTKTGKFLAHIGVDESLQLFNVLAGEMSFVGPRPLPCEEAKFVEDKYKERLGVRPGIISPWIFNGYHSLEFGQWMESDMEYIRSKSLMNDFGLCLKAIVTLIKMVIKETFSR